MQNGAPLYPKNMCLLYGRNFSTEMNIFFLRKSGHTIEITLMESYSEETTTFFLWRSLSPQTTEMQFQMLLPSIVPRMGNGFEPQWSWGKIYEILRTVFKALKFSFYLFNKKHFFISQDRNTKRLK